MTGPLNDFDVWLKLHMLLVGMCSEGSIDHELHEQWERVIADPKGGD